MASRLTQNLKQAGRLATIVPIVLVAFGSYPASADSPRGPTPVKATSLDSRTEALASLESSPKKQDSAKTENAQKKEDSPNKEGARAQVLDASNYIGLVKAGYLAAREVPEICEKLFCYCGCDLTDCHGSLLDCFTSDHGVDCKICQEEAILALKFHKQGKTLAQIQKIIDKRYEKEYPFEVESDALKHYKATRLYKGSSKTRHNDVGALGSIEAGSLPKANGTGENDRPKRRLRKDGSCCEGKDEKPPQK